MEALVYGAAVPVRSSFSGIPLLQVTCCLSSCRLCWELVKSFVLFELVRLLHRPGILIQLKKEKINDPIPAPTRTSLSSIWMVLWFLRVEKKRTRLTPDLSGPLVLASGDWTGAHSAFVHVFNNKVCVLIQHSCVQGQDADKQCLSLRACTDNIGF